MPRSAKLRRAASIESAKFGLRDLKIRKQPRPMRFLDTMVWPRSIVSWGLRPCWGEAKVRCPRRAPVRRWNGIFAAAAKQVDWRNGFAAFDAREEGRRDRNPSERRRPKKHRRARS